MHCNNRQRISLLGLRSSAMFQEHVLPSWISSEVVDRDDVQCWTHSMLRCQEREKMKNILSIIEIPSLLPFLHLISFYHRGWLVLQTPFLASIKSANVYRILFSKRFPDCKSRNSENPFQWSYCYKSLFLLHLFRATFITNRHKISFPFIKDKCFPNKKGH